MKKFICISAVLAMALTLAMSSVHAASVGNVAAWDVGSGQPNGDFVRDYIQVYNNSQELQYQIEFALRAQERFVGPYTPVYDNTTGIYTFTVPAGVNGTSAIWNFDLSVNVWVKPGSLYDTMKKLGQIDDLTTLTLSITSDNGMSPLSVNLLDPAIRSSIDAHTIPAMGGDPADPIHFYQASQNLSWWTPTFNPNAPGTYSFSLDVAAGSSYDYPSSIFGPLMNVVVVPEPSTLALLLTVGLSLFAWAWRRR
jgi:hypothetical protein